MALPNSNAMPTYVIYRETRPGELVDPTQPPVFFPPKDSDELFDALRAKYPAVKTHSERMRDAIIEFLIEERQTEQMNSSNTAAPSPLSQSWQSFSSSSLSSPETLMSNTPAMGGSPQAPAQSITSRQASTVPSGSDSMSSAPGLDQMTSVFSLSSSEQPKQRIRRKMTDAEKVEYRKRRIAKACETCVKRKRKCHHNQPQMDRISVKSRKGMKTTTGNCISSAFESVCSPLSKERALNIRYDLDPISDWSADLQPLEDFTTLFDEHDADMFVPFQPYIPEWQWPTSGDFTLLDNYDLPSGLSLFPTGGSNSSRSSPRDSASPTDNSAQHGVAGVGAQLLQPAIGQAGGECGTPVSPTRTEAHPSGGVAMARRSGGLLTHRRSGGIASPHHNGLLWEHLRTGQPAPPGYALQTSGLGQTPLPQHTRHVHDSAGQGLLGSQFAMSASMAESSLSRGSHGRPEASSQGPLRGELVKKTGCDYCCLLLEPLGESDWTRRGDIASVYCRHLRSWHLEHAPGGQTSLSAQLRATANPPCSPSLALSMSPAEMQSDKLRSAERRSGPPASRHTTLTEYTPRRDSSATYNAQLSAATMMVPSSNTTPSVATVAVLLLACAAVLSLACNTRLVSPSILLLAALAPVSEGAASKFAARTLRTCRPSWMTTARQMLASATVAVT